ncbi:Pyrroline-5-carboxylate reductase [Rubripirellula amarantea]|uniref:Pyrroline-5-carboxylate reductase n=2 Tax=Rubripirellula amarantea TaxID=2527999 RepID=A0A5C5WH96_9BACT|nr:Pyrroline-5-carboxylate reductase [Rubripirellula amarantea]
MGRALVGGMLASDVVQADQIKVVEPNAESQAWWAANQPGVALTELASAVPASSAVLIAVKPNVVSKVLDQPNGFWDGKLVVSIAAGVSLETLSAGAGHGRVVRVMPNTPSLVGAGASAYCVGSEVTQPDRQTIDTLLGAVGLAVEVEQSQMDAVTGLSGSGPAYVCLIIEALADGGVASGLPRSLAMKLATQTVLGTAQMIQQTGRHPAELKDAVASPGGTTIAGLNALEQNGVRGGLIAAVNAATARSKELG